MIITFKPIETGNDELDVILVIIGLLLPFIIALIYVSIESGEDNEK